MCFLTGTSTVCTISCQPHGELNRRFSWKSSNGRTPCCSPFPQSGFGKHNKMFQNVSFRLYYNTKLQLRDWKINTDTQVKFKILLGSKLKKKY